MDNIESSASYMRFDVVRFTCGMKSIMIAAVFNVGTSGTIPAIAPKGNAVTPTCYLFLLKNLIMNAILLERHVRLTLFTRLRLLSL